MRRLLTAAVVLGVATAGILQAGPRGPGSAPAMPSPAAGSAFGARAVPAQPSAGFGSPSFPANPSGISNMPVNPPGQPFGGAASTPPGNAHGLDKAPPNPQGNAYGLNGVPPNPPGNAYGLRDAAPGQALGKNGPAPFPAAAAPPAPSRPWWKRVFPFGKRQ
jgi:hypothetical protein